MDHTSSAGPSSTGISFSTTGMGHACNLSHCTRCGECISLPRILCDICRKACCHE